MEQITVIIPTYNRQEHLKRSVNSVLKQSYQNFQLIVVDDGSTDGSAFYIENLAHPKIKLITQNNRGVSSARNIGIVAAQTEWIAFLDSDDEWFPQKLQAQVDFIQKNPHLEFIHSNEIWNRNGVRVNPPKKFDKSNDEIFRRSLEMCLISPSTVMMKKSLAEKHGRFNEEFIICEDYDLWLKILARQEVGFMSDHLITKYGGHEDQLSTKYPAMDYWRIRSMVDLYKADISSDKKSLIKEEILNKAPILLNGYMKHQNKEKFDEVTKMIKEVI